jgi:hypothetical protein
VVWHASFRRTVEEANESVRCRERKLSVEYHLLESLVDPKKNTQMSTREL